MLFYKWMQNNAPNIILVSAQNGERKVVERLLLVWYQIIDCSYDLNDTRYGS